ncbi:MAG: histidine phosphatase family protein [Spirochaetaceae bacterium]|nr:histidine phosphatase family protein [Spirochaetaceae bacterium]
MSEYKEYTIVIVRHGFSLGNKLKTLSGQSNVPLMEQGRKELKKHREMYDYPITDLNYSSDLSRAVSTFETLYEGKGKLDGVFPQLREINFGGWENRPFDSVIFKDFFGNWIQDIYVTDSETFEQIKTRMIGFFKMTIIELQEENLHSATLVSHMIAIRCLLVGLGIYKKENFFNIKTPNGLGYKINVLFDGENIKIKSFVAINQLLK